VLVFNATEKLQYSVTIETAFLEYKLTYLQKRKFGSVVLKYVTDITHDHRKLMKMRQKYCNLMTQCNVNGMFCGNDDNTNSQMKVNRQINNQRIV